VWEWTVRACIRRTGQVPDNQSDLETAIAEWLRLQLGFALDAHETKVLPQRLGFERRKIGSRKTNLPLHTLLEIILFDHLQETNLHFERCSPISQRDAFGLHLPVIGARLRLTIFAWIEDTEIEALFIFYRGRPVRIQHVPFIQDSICNLFDGIVDHKAMLSSDWARIRSMACSQVGIPWSVL